jgi:hypothetical protein
VSRRASPGIVTALGILGWYTAAYRPTGGTRAMSAAPHRESAGVSGSQECPPSAGFNAGSVADHGAGTASGRTIALEAGDSYFEPTCETGVPRGEVEVQVKNTGRLLHNISFENPAIDHDVAPGETVRVKLTMGNAPRRFSCKYHRGGGMMGALLPLGVRTTR